MRKIKMSIAAPATAIPIMVGRVRARDVSRAVHEIRIKGHVKPNMAVTCTPHSPTQIRSKTVLFIMWELYANL